MASGWAIPVDRLAAGAPPEIRWAQPRPLNRVDPYWLRAPEPAPSVRPFVLRAEEGRLLGPDAWLVVRNDTFVYDCSFWGHRDFRAARRWHAIFRRKRALPARRLEGRVLSLASDFAAFGFGHWLHDSLPRLLLLERVGLDPAAFDRIVLPGPDTASTRLLLERLGWPAHKLVTAPSTDDLTCAELTAVSFPGSPGAVSSLARDLAIRLVPPGRRRRRLYLSRAGFRRNLENEPELAAVFDELGFERCDPASDPAIVRKCAEAAIIVGIEGSQCLNALFAPEGAALVGIVPDGFAPLPYLQSLAGAAGLELYLLGARRAGAGESCRITASELRSGLARVIERTLER